MKTAMQIAIENIDQCLNADDTKDMLINLLEKEKEQIIDAYENSINTILLLPSGIKSQKGSAEDYYKKTYNN